MEPGTGLTILGTAIGSAKILEKLLGPTADYLGGKVKDYSEKGLNNLGNIFKSATQKLGSQIDQPGQVPAKVLKEILYEGYYCEDHLATEYFGGVLASSRSKISRDDRGATFTKLIGRLSSYQLRAHYILYTMLKKEYNGQDIDIDSHNAVKKHFIFPRETFLVAMDFQADEPLDAIISHIFLGLAREGLIGNDWVLADTKSVGRFINIKGDKGIMGFFPEGLGFELYLWAHGLGNKDLNSFYEKEIVFNKIKDIYIPDY